MVVTIVEESLSQPPLFEGRYRGLPPSSPEVESTPPIQSPSSPSPSSFSSSSPAAQQLPGVWASASGLLKKKGGWGGFLEREGHPPEEENFQLCVEADDDDDTGDVTHVVI
jgi:hypothetical protein